MEKVNELFKSLVYSFHFQTMMNLGKIKNPVSDKIEKDLNAAEMSIDILEMLKTKTAGNLDESEVRFLDAVLTEVRMNYASEKSKPEEITDSGKEEEKNT
ncbi:MAG: DUF1844 domain-containing protein [Ignavibacteria bacterium]|nr:DUF1844 domain-containing protein [Ignavibacteria bacterium]HCN37657.1 DUF1844 domain-containing protein [Bacteroidota bacterium]